MEQQLPGETSVSLWEKAALLPVLVSVFQEVMLLCLCASLWLKIKHSMFTDESIGFSLGVLWVYKNKKCVLCFHISLYLWTLIQIQKRVCLIQTCPFVTIRNRSTAKLNEDKS